MNSNSIGGVAGAEQPAHHKHTSVTLPDFSLSAVMKKVAKTNEGWSHDRLTIAEKDYRDFLAHAKRKVGRLAPSADVDEVWHTHIIFTQQYHADCEKYFGYYLHHLPSSPEDMAKRGLCSPPCVCVQPPEPELSTH